MHGFAQRWAFCKLYSMDAEQLQLECEHVNMHACACTYIFRTTTFSNNKRSCFFSNHCCHFCTFVIIRQPSEQVRLRIPRPRLRYRVKRTNNQPTVMVVVGMCESLCECVPNFIPRVNYFQAVNLEQGHSTLERICNMSHKWFNISTTCTWNAHKCE